LAGGPEEKTHSVKKLSCKKTCRGGREKNVHCVKNPRVKKLPVGRGAGGKSALCKKLSCIYRMYGGKNVHCVKNQSVKKYQLAGGPEEKMHSVKNPFVKKHTSKKYRGRKHDLCRQAAIGVLVGNRPGGASMFHVMNLRCRKHTYFMLSIPSLHTAISLFVNVHRFPRLFCSF
jgi:hypothetical protein